ncbi:3'(2'),5'-bisphosphate nucleotidase CysQ [Gammaproteobacteria bacterium]|nr:3'(2'),5'-bisphosphate nucleotidase CysQ [Gammaproteobacteria bacterium]|tara:strand:- start:41 stop:937 length:897 start_codon:yes stop_codon:yes gene_type:complete
MKITQAFIDSIYEALEETVIDASNAIIEVYKSESFNTEIKSDGSPVTEADKRANDIITESLRKITPDIPVVSEETYDPEEPNPNKPYWLVDPLDGTKEFINKSNDFTVNIALIENSIPIFGIIAAPAKRKIWSGSFFKRPSKLIKSIKYLGHMLNDPYTFDKYHAARQPVRIVMSKSHQTDIDKKFLQFLDKRLYVHVPGIPPYYTVVEKGSSLKLCALADNEADIYPRFGPTSEWDIAAGHACLRQQGGRVCQMSSGEPLAYTKEESILNPAFVCFRNTYLKDKYLGLISEFYKKLV